MVYQYGKDVRFVSEKVLLVLSKKDMTTYHFATILFFLHDTFILLCYLRHLLGVYIRQFHHGAYRKRFE